MPGTTLRCALTYVPLLTALWGMLLWLTLNRREICPQERISYLFKIVQVENFRVRIWIQIICLQSSTSVINNKIVVRIENWGDKNSMWLLYMPVQAAQQMYLRSEWWKKKKRSNKCKSQRNKSVAFRVYTHNSRKRGIQRNSNNSVWGSKGNDGIAM